MKIQSEPHTVGEPNTAEEVMQSDNLVIKKNFAIVKERMVEFVGWARSGNRKPLQAFVSVARRSGGTDQLIFDSFTELLPDLSRQEFEALLKD